MTLDNQIVGLALVGLLVVFICLPVLFVQLRSQIQSKDHMTLLLISPMPQIWQHCWRLTIKWTFLGSASIYVVWSIILATTNNGRGCEANILDQDDHKAFGEVFEMWWKPVLGICLLFLSEIRYEHGHNLHFDGYSMALEFGWRSPDGGSIKNGRTRMVQLTMRLFGYDLVLLFLAERDFFLMTMALFLLVLHRCIFNVLWYPFEKPWTEMYKVAQAGGNDDILRSSSSEPLPSTPLMEQSAELCSRTITARNVFLDMTQKFGFKVCTVFAGQVIVFLVYIWGVHDDTYEFLCAGTMSWQVHNYVLLTCCVILQYLMCAVMGSSFVNYLFDWYLILEAGHMKHIEVVCNEEGEELFEWKVQVNLLQQERWTNTEMTETQKREHYFFRICHPYLKTRCAMDFLSNAVIYMFLIYILPLALIGNTDGMDFAKDCVAIAFITTLDDTSAEDGSATFKVHYERKNVHRGQEIDDPLDPCIRCIWDYLITTQFVSVCWRVWDSLRHICTDTFVPLCRCIWEALKYKRQNGSPCANVNVSA